jgi:hypothetical protein
MAEPTPVRTEGAAGAACVLLAGAIKPSPLVELTGFSTLDLLVSPDETLFDLWTRRLREIGVEPSAIVAVHGDNVPSPTATPETIAVRQRRERDHLRGPAGAAKDAIAEFGGHDPIIIAEGKRHPGPGLGPLVDAWNNGGADVVVGRNPGGEPAGVYLARRSLLELAPDKGFMDLKEQWLDRVVQTGAHVVVVDLPPPGTRPLRILPHYLCAALDPSGLGAEFATGVLAAGEAARSLVCPSANVDPAAELVDAVVMEGARVGKGALVIRSIICPGGRVEPGAQVVDAVVTERGVRSDKMPLGQAGRVSA